MKKTLIGGFLTLSGTIGVSALFEGVEQDLVNGRATRREDS